MSLRWVTLGICVMLPLFAISAHAQPFPLPPPLPSPSTSEERIAAGDKTPPEIEILTDELKPGVNVFEVKITDDSTLRVREVKYVQNGNLKTDGLYMDKDNVYKALIDIEPPARIVVVTAGDSAGNLATAYKEYAIPERSDIITEIASVFTGLTDYLQIIMSKVQQWGR